MTSDQETIRLLKMEIQDLQDEVEELRRRLVRAPKLGTERLPLPPRGRPVIYPFRKMEVGHCFRVPMEKRPSVHQGAVRVGRATGRKFCVRPIDDATVGVWRVA